MTAPEQRAYRRGYYAGRQAIEAGLVPAGLWG
jgi:hypothetical protein